MAVGAEDPDAGAMHALRLTIRGCPEPLTLSGVGHFVQENGEGVARAALRAFASS